MASPLVLPSNGGKMPLRSFAYYIQSDGYRCLISKMNVGIKINQSIFCSKGNDAPYEKAAFPFVLLLCGSC